MTSYHEEKVAVYLQSAGANSHKGVTAIEVTLACNLPDKLAYKILREGRGFFKSNFPRRPQGWYFDMPQAVSQMLDNSKNLAIMSAVTDNADATLKTATYLEQQMTDVGKILSQTDIVANDEDILKTIGSIVAPKSYSLQHMKDNVAKATNVSELKVWLVLCLVASNRNLVVEDKDFKKPAKPVTTIEPTEPAKSNVPVVDTETFARNKWVRVYKHFGLKGNDYLKMSDTEKQELNNKYDAEGLL